MRNLLKKLHAGIRKSLQGDRRPDRRARLGLETLERRDVPAAPIDIVTATFGSTTYEFGISTGTVVRSADNGTTWKAVTGTNTNATQLLTNNGGLYMLASNNGPAMQNVWQYTGSGINWTQITGPYMNVSDLTVWNSSLFMLGTNGPANETVYQWTGTGNKWTAVTGTNTNATQLLEWSGNLVMLGSNGGTIQSAWEYNGTGVSWAQITGPNMNVTSLTKATNKLYMLASNGTAIANGPAYQTISQYTGTGKQWTAITDTSTNALALVKADGNNLYMLANNPYSTCNEVYTYSGSGTSWVLSSSAAPPTSAITALAGNLYMLGNNGAHGQDVYEYNDSNQTWTDLSGTYLSATALVKSNGFLFALGSSGTNYQSVWQYSPATGSWTAITGSTTYAASLVAAQGGLFMLGTNGPGYNSVWEYSGTGQSWNQVTDSTKQAYQLVVADNSLYMVAGNPGGTPCVWQYSNPGTGWTLLLGSSVSTALATWSLYESEPPAVYGYSPATGSLFASGSTPATEVAYTDVEQGSLGDCWLMASLAEVAARAPADLTSSNMFIYDGSTTEAGNTVSVYSVRFYNALGTAEYVTVDTELPGGGFTAQLNGDLWVALAEKAYAEANALGYVMSSNPIQNSYAALGSGDPAWALSAITGVQATDYWVNPTTLANAWNAGHLIVLTTNTTTQDPDIVGNHAYAMIGYSSTSNTPFQIYNPWGTFPSGQWIDSPTLTTNFYAQTVGAGAPVGAQGASSAGSWQEWANSLVTGILQDPHAKPVYV